MHPRQMTRSFFLGCIGLLAIGLAGVVRADTYSIDGVHSSVTFWAGHLGISWIHGRFNEVEGTLILDAADPAKSSLTAKIQVNSVDTANKKRDQHLQSPDFFNAKQFPLITFESKSLKKAENGYDVTGDLTIHGVTKSTTFRLKGGKTAQFPPGTHRIGFAAELKIKRSDFGMNNLLNAVSDDVLIVIGLEGVKK